MNIIDAAIILGVVFFFLPILLPALIGIDKKKSPQE